MSEEQTDRLEGSTPFEIRVLRELSNLNRRFDSLEVRLTNLEEKVDARLRDTRPIWESVLSRLDSIEARLDRIEGRLDSVETRLDSVETRLDRIEARLDKMDAKFDVVAREWFDLRADVDMLKSRPPAA